jgi:hypothetical protein
LCPVYKKGDKLDCTNYAIVLYDRLLPYANAVVQHYQAGFQSRKLTTYQLPTSNIPTTSKLTIFS